VNLRIWIGTLCGVFALAFALQAAELESDLENQLHQAAAKGNLERFSVIVELYSPRDLRALDEELHKRRAPLAERHREVIEALRANAEETQGPVLKRLDEWKRNGDVAGHTAYWIGNLIVVYGRAEAILALATDPAVRSIGPNFKAELIGPVNRGPVRSRRLGPLDDELTTPGQNATGAVRVIRELGYTGEGVLIAGLDTGVDGEHPALASRWRGNFAPTGECWLDLLGTGTTRPVDTHGHGTHTMGTMTGREIQSDGDTITVGAAPNARWIATNPINQNVSQEFINDIFTAFQWLVDPDGNEQTMDDVPDVIQNSWGVTQGHVGIPCFNNWNQVILNCEAAGPVITWSAGNEAEAGLRSPAKYQLTTTQIFAVGAVDATHYSAPYPAATFSSRGPSRCPPDSLAIKPEIAAPGVAVLSSVPGGGYESQGWDGTSMAGPHVAGIVALMREACPDCDPETIKRALMLTAIDEGYPPAGEDNTFGMGFIDGYAAVQAVADLGWVIGHATEPDGDPIAGVHISVEDLPNHSLTDSAGSYRVGVPAGLRTLRYTKFGYETIIADSLTIIERDTTTIDVTMQTVPQGVLSGTVAAQSGIPVQGAQVTFLDVPVDPLVTDENGRFVVELPATSYEVRVTLTIHLQPPLTLETDTVLTVQAGDTTFVVVPIFVPLIEPTAADLYGYRAYDRYDRDLPAPYAWTDLDPTTGGMGETFTFVNHDAGRQFAAPFPLSFYGSVWDTLTVNCNGWMLPGVHYMSGAQRSPIPGHATGDPPGIIAPYWANLRNGMGAHQYQWYDSANGRWVLEFVSQHLLSPSDSAADWEVTLLDPAFHPTSTGDGDIEFMYGRTGYTDRITVGIERPDETTGLQILHSGSLNSTSWPVEPGAAIRFTTGLAEEFGSVTVTLSLYPPPEDIHTAAVRLGGRLIIADAGGVFVQDSIPAAPVSGVLMLPGWEMTRVTRVPIAANEMTQVALEAWRLDPPRNLSGQREDSMIVLSWRIPESVELYPYPGIRYDVYRNGARIAAALADTAFTDSALPDSGELIYTVMAFYHRGRSVPSEPLRVVIDLAAHDRTVSVPSYYMLHPNFPNPFNPSTQILLDVPERTDAQLEIFDLTGRLVRTLWAGSLTPGRHSFMWDGRSDGGAPAATGMYLCRVVSPAYSATQKMLLIR
jgi:subtilisin family serine protease